MTDGLTLQLNDAQSGHKAMAFAWSKAKPLLPGLPPRARRLAWDQAALDVEEDDEAEGDQPGGAEGDSGMNREERRDFWNRAYLNTMQVLIEQEPEELAKAIHS